MVPATQIKSTFPVLKNPANHHKAVGYTLEQWPYAFTNTFPERVPGDLTSATTCPPRAGSSGTACWPTSSPATRAPGWTTRTTTGRRCCSSPAARTTSCRPDPAVERQALQVGHGHRDQGVRGLPHLLPAQEAGKRSPTTCWTGPWPTPARSSSRSRVSDLRLTHIGGPTVLVEVGGLADPVRSRPSTPGPELLLRLGVGVAEARRARRVAGGRHRARSTWSSSPTTTTPTTSTTPAGRCSATADVVVTTSSGAKRLGGDDARARPLGRHPARAPGPTDHRDRGHAVPPRSSAQPADRRPRDRLRACAGRASSTACCGSRGDTVLYPGVREVAGRLEVDIALLHVGCVRFGITGPLKYTMTIDEAAELCRSVQPSRRDPRALRGLVALHRGPLDDRGAPRTAAGRRARAVPVAPDRRAGFCVEIGCWGDRFLRRNAQAVARPTWGRPRRGRTPRRRSTCTCGAAARSRPAARRA